MAARGDLIPQRPDEITTAWLTETLAHDATVVSFVASSPGSGVGFSGITTKLTLEWDVDDASLPREIVAKFPTDLAHRGLTEQEGAYEREIWFYEGMGNDMPTRIPTCHYATMDPGVAEEKRRRTSARMNRTPAPIARFIAKRVNRFIRATDRRYVLLIEYVPGARITKLDEPVPGADLRRILDALAEMHARYWDDPRLETDPCTSYNTASQNFKFLQAGYRLWADDFFARTPGLDVRHRVVTDWADENLDQLLDRLDQRITLLHGDARSENMLFLDDGELVMIDFGAVSSGPPGWDVAYALSAAIEPGPEARQTLEEMVDVYHQSLTGFGVSDHSIETLRRDVDLAMCFLGHRQVLAAAVVEGGYETGNADPTSLGDVWMRKIINLLPDQPPSLES